MSQLKALKDKRFRRTALICVIALLMLATCYFVSVNKTEKSSISVDTSKSVVASEKEKKLCAILSEIEGVGAINAYITEDGAGNAISAILVLEGADSISVRMDVLNITAQALGVNPKKVSIYKMTDK